MKTINGVNFYAKTDVLYSRGGFLALNDQLEPCGIFVPGIKGLEYVVSTDELDENDADLIAFANGFKALTGN